MIVFTNKRTTCLTLQVKWLKLHDEYFSMLLEEVQDEADKSYNFVIDREIEAPDTFRAIQSYRAAVIVLKDMQGYVCNLLEVGVIEGSESDIVLEYINEKLRKLELTGPVWRPPKLKEIMKSMKPFSELTSESANWIWDLGLVQEYKPGEVIFQEDLHDSSKYGVFHLLNGVANKQVWSSGGSIIYEEYCAYGSCFGASRALSMSPIHGKEVITATGNALGRGPTVFHITQNDIDKISLLGLSGSSDMTNLVTGWTRLAALNVLDSVQEELSHLIELCLHKSIDGVQKKDEGYMPTVTEEAQILDEHASPTLDSFLSTKDFGLKLLVDEKSREKLVEQRARGLTKEISAGLRKKIFTSEVKHAFYNEVICQTSSIILLSGSLKNTIKSSKYPKREVNAPAVLPHLDASENLFIEGISGTEILDMFWEVISDTATLVVCSKNS
jgi:hypothetical protein